MTSNVLAFLPKGAISMTTEQTDPNEDAKGRSVVLPISLWKKIEKDAERCRRSVTKHLEAILSLYYGLEASVNIDEEALTRTREAISHKQQSKKVA